MQNPNRGGTPSRKIGKYFGGNNLWVSISEMQGNIIIDTKEKITNEGVKNSNVKLIPKGTTLLSFKLSIGKTAIAGVDLYTNEAIAALVPLDKNQILDEYIFHYFTVSDLDLSHSGNNVFGKSLNIKYLNEYIKIPVPPLAEQQKIINKINTYEAEISKHKSIIQQISAKKQEILKTYL